MLDGDLTLARVNLASLIAKTGRISDALGLWNDLIDEGLFDRQLISEAIDGALGVGAIQHATKWAKICGAFLRGATQLPAVAKSVVPKPVLIPAMLTMETLTHDIQQIEYLRRRNLDLDLDSMVANYEHVRVAMEASGDRRRRRLNDEEQRLIGDTYGRIWHTRETPRLGSTSLWGKWDPHMVENAYCNSRLGLCVIDNL